MQNTVPKIETAENWAKAKNFIPKKNQIIIYDGRQENEEYVTLPKIKLGDGIHTVSELPFVSSFETAFVSDDGSLVIISGDKL